MSWNRRWASKDSYLDIDDHRVRRGEVRSNDPEEDCGSVPSSGCVRVSGVRDAERNQKIRRGLRVGIREKAERVQSFKIRMRNGG